MHAQHPPSRPGQTPGFAADTVLECARGLAALWVFMFHITPIFAPWPALATFARYGHQGVPLFFVISGYCMYAAASNTLQAGRGPSSFLQRRLWRIFPPFWLSVLVVMLAPYLLAAASAVKGGGYTAPSPAWTAFGWLDWVELLTLTKVFNNAGGDLQAGFTPVNAVYWSLAIEVQFYLVMYASLFLRSAWRKALLWVTLLSVLAAFSAPLNNSGLFMKYWPAFALGALLRHAHQRGWTPAAAFGQRQLALSLCGTAVLLAAVMAIVFAPVCSTPLACSPVPNLTFTAASAVAALGLWLLAGIEHGWRYAASPALARCAWLLLPFAWLGQSSYSLYLLHGKIHQLPMMVFRQLVSPASLAYPALVISATAAMCYGFYLIAERPFHTLAKRAGAASATPRPQAASAQ